MIVNFSIQNFGSIKNRQTVSFEADESTHLEDAYVMDAGGTRLLKLALIYGPNASGKTTILKALDFLRELVLEPADKKTDELDFEPFLFDRETPEQHSTLSIEFLQEGIKYFYEVEFTKKAIVREELFFFNPDKVLIDLLLNRSRETAGERLLPREGKRFTSLRPELEHTVNENRFSLDKTRRYFMKTNKDIYARLKPYLEHAIENAGELGNFDEKNPLKALSEMDELFRIEALQTIR